MTTIIAVETAKGNYWGWDSQVSFGGSKDSLEPGKVFSNGEYIIGVAGYWADSQNLRYSKLPKVPEGDIDVDRFITTKVIPRIHKLTKSKSIVLLETRGRVYSIMGGSWVRNEDGVYAVGSGADYAVGAVVAGANPIEALQIAANYDSGTGGRLTMVDSAELLSGNEIVFTQINPEEAKPKKKKGKKK